MRDQTVLFVGLHELMGRSRVARFDRSHRKLSRSFAKTLSLANMDFAAFARQHPPDGSFALRILTRPRHGGARICRSASNRTR